MDYGWKRVLVTKMGKDKYWEPHCSPCGNMFEDGDTGWRKGRFWLCGKCFRVYVVEPGVDEESLFWRETIG